MSQEQESTFLTKDKIESIVKEPVKSFSLDVGCAKGDNVAGSINNLKVDLVQGSSVNLIYKTLPDLTPTNQEIRGYLITCQVFRAENAFYSVLLPLLEKHSKSSLPVPKYYEGFNDDQNDYIILEDLRTSGYKMPDKFVGLSYPEMVLVMAELAKFHATTYSLLKYEGESLFDREFGDKKQKLDIFNRMEILMKNSPEMVQVFKGMMGNGYKLLKNVVQKRFPELAEKMDKVLGSNDEIFEITSKTSKETDVKHFPCIIHGDFWVNNILIKYDDKTGQPMSTKFIDFQGVRRGNIFEELQYFISTSTTVEFRKKHLTQVLEIYYQSFQAQLKVLNCTPPQGFTRGFFIDSYDECVFRGFVYLGFAIPLQLGVPSDNPFEQMGDGNKNDGQVQVEITPEMKAQFMLDNFTNMVENSPRAVERILSIAQEMEELKLI